MSDEKRSQQQGPVDNSQKGIESGRASEIGPPKYYPPSQAIRPTTQPSQENKPPQKPPQDSGK